MDEHYDNQELAAEAEMVHTWVLDHTTRKCRGDKGGKCSVNFRGVRVYADNCNFAFFGLMQAIGKRPRLVELISDRWLTDQLSQP